MSDTPIQNVSDTAFMVAAFRALESERPNPLFRDPLAARLSGERGKRILAKLPLVYFGRWTVELRTVIIDDFIASALAEGVDTVLNLGAGLDTRPYRMVLPADLSWIEVDYPAMIDFKESELKDEAPVCRLERLKVDLAEPAACRALLREVAARGGKVLVITEGVTPYLSNDEVGALAGDLREHPAFRYWILDHYSAEALRYRKRRGHNQLMKNAPFRFEPGDWFGFFASRGWKPKTIRYVVDEAKRLDRPLPWPWYLRVVIALRRPFLSRARREAFRKFAGYVVLEPS